MVLISVQPGSEVMATVAGYVQEHGIESGAIVSLVGAVDECCISNMPNNDSKSDILTTIQQPFEMSGTGEIKNGKPHIHCVLGAEGNGALAGHLHWAKVDTWFVNVYVVPM